MNLHQISSWCCSALEGLRSTAHTDLCGFDSELYKCQSEVFVALLTFFPFSLCPLTSMHAQSAA